MIISWEQSLLIILPLISAGVSLLLAVSTWQKRDVPGSLCLTGLLLGIAEWSLFTTLENASFSTTAKLFWSQTQYLGIVSVPVFFLIFASRYCQMDGWLTRRTLILLWVIPAITITFSATNRFHGWMWRDFEVVTANQNLIFERGFWFWVHAAYSYLCLLGATIILFRSAFQINRIHRRQIWMVVLSGLFPWVANILYLSKLIPIPGLDPTPYAFMLTGLFITLSITEYRFIDISPIARSKLVDIMQDSLVVIDPSGIIVDLNPAFLNLIGADRHVAIGKPAAQILDIFPYISSRFADLDISSTQPKVITDGAGRWFDLRISSLRNNKGRFTGSLVILRDITDQKNTESDLSRLATVVEQANESIFITDLNGKIIYINPSFEIVTGYSAEEALGKNPNILNSGLQNKTIYKELWQTIGSGNIWKGQFINRHKNGSLIHESATIFPIKDKSGKITNYAAVKRDISAEVEAKKAIQYFVEGLENLYQLSIQMSIAATFDEMCKLAIASGTKLLDIDRISIWIIDPQDSDYLIGSYGIDENGNIRDERNQRLPIAESPEYLKDLQNKEHLYHQQRSPLRNDQFEIIGYGDLVVIGIWDQNNIIGYLCADNYISQREISEQHRSVLVLLSQTLGNLTVRKKADEALQEFSSYLEILHEVNMALSLMHSFDEMCKRAIELGRSHLGFDRLSLWFLDAEDENIILGSFGIDEKNQVVDERHRRVEINSDPVHKTLLSGSPRVYFRKNIKLIDQNQKTIGNGDMAGVALWDGSNIVGYIKVDNLISQKPISNHQLDILILFAQTIGNLSTRLRTSEKIRINARNQALLNEITRTAISQSDFDEMLQTLADQMGELFNADGCFISLWDEELQQAIPTKAYGPYKNTYSNIEPEPNEPTLTKYVLSTNEILMVEDVLNSPYLSKRLAQQFVSRSLLAIPLISNVRLGAAIISYNDSHRFTSEEINLAENAAQQISLAISKAQLYDEAQRRATEAETLRQASGAIVTTLKRDETIEKILEELNRVVPYDSASVQLLRGKKFEIVGERGFAPLTTIGIHFPITHETPNALVFEKNIPHIIYDALLEFPAFSQPPHDHIRGWMGVPLRIHEKMIGMLALDSFTPGRFTEDHARMAQAFADHVAIALENSRLFEETQRLALHDSLTGLFNRRHFMDLARIEFQSAKRYNDPLSAIMLDIDFFKNINDTYGHLIGDQVLQYVANYSKNDLRINDLIGRYGGEEFVILLPRTASNTSVNPSENESVESVAERLRKGIESAKVKTERGKVSVTISLGVAELNPNCMNVENLIDFADQALLIAKQTGRNKVVYWHNIAK